MRLTVRRIRAIINEAGRGNVRRPTLDWGEWYDALDLAAGEAGYELLSDLPVYDSITSQSLASQRLESVLIQLWKQGTSPEAAVSQMEDPGTFWTKWGRWSPGDVVEHKARHVREAKVAAGSDYMRKERVREALQGLVSGMVSSGQLRDQASLDEAFLALDMSVKALKMVPFEVWQRTAAVKPRKA